MTDPTQTAAAAAPAVEAAPSHESFLHKLEGEALQGYIHGLTIARDGIEHTSSKVINTLTNWIGDAESKLNGPKPVPATAGANDAGKPPAAPAGGGASSSASTPEPTAAIAAYNAYKFAVGGKAVNGDVLPLWADLTATVQSGWIAAANAVQSSTQQKAAA